MSWQFSLQSRRASPVSVLGSSQFGFGGVVFQPLNTSGLVMRHFPEVGEAVKQTALNSSDWTLECLGDLLVTQSFAEPEHQCLTLPIGKLGDSRPQTCLPLVHFQMAHRRYFAPPLFLPPLGYDPQTALPRRSAPPLATFQIQQDPIQPCENLTPSGKSVGLARQYQKGLLRQIVRIPRIAGQYQGGTVNPLEILLGYLIYVNSHK